MPLYMNRTEAKEFGVAWMSSAHWVHLKFVLPDGTETTLKIDCEHLIPVKTLSILIFNGKKINVAQLSILEQIIDRYNQPKKSSNKFNMQGPTFGQASKPRPYVEHFAPAVRADTFKAAPRSVFPPPSDAARQKAAARFQQARFQQASKMPPGGRYRDPNFFGGGGEEKLPSPAAQLLADALTTPSSAPRRAWGAFLQAHSKLRGQIGPHVATLNLHEFQLALFFWAHDICNGIKSALQCIALWIWENCTPEGKSKLLVGFLQGIIETVLFKPLEELPYHIEDFMDEFCRTNGLRRVVDDDWNKLRSVAGATMKNWIWLPEISNVLVFLYSLWYGITLKTAADLYVTVSLQNIINGQAAAAGLSMAERKANIAIAETYKKRATDAAPTFFKEGQTPRAKTVGALGRDMEEMKKVVEAWKKKSGYAPAAPKRQIFSWYLRTKWAYIKWRLLFDLKDHADKVQETESWEIATRSNNDKNWWFRSQMQLIVRKFYLVCFAFIDSQFEIKWKTFWGESTKNMSKKNIKAMGAKLRTMRAIARDQGGGGVVPAEVKKFNTFLRTKCRNAFLAVKAKRAFGGFTPPELKKKEIIQHINTLTVKELKIILQHQTMKQSGDRRELKRRLQAAVLGLDWWITAPSPKKQAKYTTSRRKSKPIMYIKDLFGKGAVEEARVTRTGDICSENSAYKIPKKE